MAGRPLKVAVDVDMSQLIRAAKDAGGAAEGLADSFTDAGQEATDATRTATRGLDDIDRASDDAAGSVGKVGDAAGSVGDALGGLGDAASDALKGDVSGAADSALSALSGLAAAIPGVGGLVAGALAATVGAWISSLDLFGEKTKAIREEVSSALVDVGGAFSQADLASRIQAVVSNTDTWANANTIAKATGMDLVDVVTALAGDADLAAEATDKLRFAAEKGLNGEGPATWIPSKDLWDASQALDGVTQGLADGATKADVAAEAMAGVTQKTNDANQAALDYMHSLANIPATKSTTVTLDADASAIERAISRFQGRRIQVELGPGTGTVWK